MARNRRERNEANADKFGFRWGQLDVIRNAEFNGKKSLSVLTDWAEIEIGVSDKGHRIRVYKNGRELT
jgi:hypothetical protein